MSGLIAAVIFSLLWIISVCVWAFLLGAFIGCAVLLFAAIRICFFYERLQAKSSRGRKWRKQEENEKGRGRRKDTETTKQKSRKERKRNKQTNKQTNKQRKKVCVYIKRKTKKGKADDERIENKKWYIGDVVGIARHRTSKNSQEAAMKY